MPLLTLVFPLLTRGILERTNLKIYNTIAQQKLNILKVKKDSLVFLSIRSITS